MLNIKKYRIIKDKLDNIQKKIKEQKEELQELEDIHLKNYGSKI